MLEKKFQAYVIRSLKDRFPGCIVLKNDPAYKQGMPDLIVLYHERWAALECKKNKDAAHRPNQDYYVGRLNGMSFATFAYPENWQEVLDALERFFKRV